MAVLSAALRWELCCCVSSNETREEDGRCRRYRSPDMEQSGRTTGSVGCLVQASLCASFWRAATIFVECTLACCPLRSFPIFCGRHSSNEDVPGAAINADCVCWKIKVQPALCRPLKNMRHIDIRRRLVVSFRDRPLYPRGKRRGWLGPRACLDT
jgi:hypothetical protein